MSFLSKTNFDEDALMQGEEDSDQEQQHEK